MQTKRCRACGETKARSEFTGRYAKCKPCRATEARNRKSSDPSREVIKRQRAERRRLIAELDRLKNELERANPLLRAAKESGYVGRRIANLNRLIEEHRCKWPDLRNARERAAGEEFDERPAPPERIWDEEDGRWITGKELEELDRLCAEAWKEIQAEKAAEDRETVSPTDTLPTPKPPPLVRERPLEEISAHDEDFPECLTWEQRETLLHDPAYELDERRLALDAMDLEVVHRRERAADAYWRHRRHKSREDANKRCGSGGSKGYREDHQQAEIAGWLAANEITPETHGKVDPETGDVILDLDDLGFEPWAD